MVKRQKHSLTNSARDAITGYLFFLPWIIGFLIFTLYPIIFSVRMSFNEVTVRPDGISLHWEGLKYYNYALNVDTTFKLQLGNSLLFVCCAAPLVLVFSMIISLLLNKQFFGRSFFRVVFFIPVIIMSGPVVSNLLSGHSLEFEDYLPGVTRFCKRCRAFLQSPAR